MLNTGMILNTVICWLISGSAIITFVVVVKRGGVHKLSQSYALFWLVFALLWFLIGLRSFFSWQDYYELDKQIFFYDQILVFIHLIPIGYYISYKIWRKHLISMVTLFLYVILAYIGLFFLTLDGVEEAGSSFFIIKYLPSAKTWGIFLIIYSGVMVAAIYDCFIRFNNWLGNRRSEYLATFFTSLSPLLYGVVGLIDETAIFSDWMLIVLRAFIIIAVLMAFLNYSSQENNIIDSEA